MSTWTIIKWVMANAPAIIRFIRELQKVLNADDSGQKKKQLKKEHQKVREAMCRLGLKKDCLP